MRQEKIKCNARERKRVNEHSMKRGRRGRGGGEMVTTRGLFFATRREGRFVVSFNCTLFLNLLTRMSFVSYAVDKR